MNRHEAVIYFGNFVHIVVWLYVFFAWGLPNAKTHVWFTLVFALPLIYIIQSMPSHILVHAKLMYIKRYRSSFKTLRGFNFGSVDREVMKNISRSMQWNPRELEDLFLVMKTYEFDMQLPKLIEFGREVFDGKSFTNPLSPQGMIILAYVINVTALFIQKMRQ